MEIGEKKETKKARKAKKIRCLSESPPNFKSCNKKTNAEIENFTQNKGDNMFFYGMFSCRHTPIAFLKNNYFQQSSMLDMISENILYSFPLKQSIIVPLFINFLEIHEKFLDLFLI